MNSSIEKSRQIPIHNTNDISLNDSQMENFYLDASDIDESLLEQYYAAEAETIHFNGSNQLTLEPFDSNILSNRQNVCVSQSNQAQSKQQLATEDKSIIVNCKTFCKDLMKPIANKITKKLLKRPTSDKSSQVTQSIQSVHHQPHLRQFNTHAPTSTHAASLKFKTHRVHFKFVPSVQPAHLNIIPSETTKSANNRFSNLGDIVYYNI